MTFLTFIKDNFTGVDGKSSAKMWSAFWFVILITVIIVNVVIFVWYALTRSIIISDNELKAAAFFLDILLYLLGTVLLIYGVITVQNIVALKSGLPSINSSSIVKTVEQTESHTTSAVPDDTKK